MIFDTILKRQSTSILALFGTLMCVEIDGSPEATELIVLITISQKMIIGSECLGNDDCESTCVFTCVRKPLFLLDHMF